VDEPTKRKAERRVSWLVVALAAVVVIMAGFWLLYPIVLA
jgi:cytoskeletal protein RodZ